MRRGESTALKNFRKIRLINRTCAYHKDIYSHEPCGLKAEYFMFDKDGDIYTLYCKEHGLRIKKMFADSFIYTNMY